MSGVRELLANIVEFPSWLSLLVHAGALLLLCCICFFQTARHQELPVINRNWWEWTDGNAKQRFIKDAKALIRKGFSKYSGPFWLITDTGPILIMPETAIEAIDKEPNLDFRAFAAELNLSHIETFRVFEEPPRHFLEETVRKGLTRDLGRFTETMNVEAETCLNKIWGDMSGNWTEVDIGRDALTIVAHLTTVVLLGPEFADRADLLRVSLKWGLVANNAMQAVKRWPWFLQATASHFLPLCKELRAQTAAARAILAQFVDAREQLLASSDQVIDTPDDLLGWLRTTGKGRPHDKTGLLLGLVNGTTPTTTDLLTDAIIRLCLHPHVVSFLRAEIAEVSQDHGWKQNALQQLRLMDSFLKETMRLKPVSMLTMHRKALQTVRLSNGVTIRKGQNLAVSSHRMWEASHFTDPLDFDLFRFAKCGTSPQRSLFTSTSTDSLGFSHGRHACPGRHFVALEVKIILVQLLLGYDFRLVNEYQPKALEYGSALISDPKARIEVRRRADSTE